MIIPMTKTSTALYLGAFILLALFAGYNFIPQAKASAPAGILATIATSSNPTIPTAAVALFATSTCAARIVSTTGAPIMLTFSDFSGQTPTAVLGHPQAASTTVIYDASQVGCGLFKAVSTTGAATSIFVSETR